MVDVHGRVCLHDSCMKRLNFNFEAHKLAAYCKQHAEDGMVDVRSRRCLNVSCTKTPNYNFEGHKPAAYCKQHAEDGMVDGLHRRCLNDSCRTFACFNFDGSKTTAYCKQHAEDGMVNVRDKRCLRASCTKQARFKFDGREKAYCKLHADDAMVGVCTKRPSNDSRTVVRTSRSVPTDGVPIVRVRLKREIVDRPVMDISIEAPCQVAGCLKRSRREVGGKQLTHCLDHAPPEAGLVPHAAAVEMAHRKRGFRASPYLGSGTDLDDNRGGSSDRVDTTAKRTRRLL